MPLDSGDTSWMLIASSLVLLMIPALGMFEAGLLRKKNTVSIFMQIFFGLAILSVMWFTFGFSLTFGPDTGTGLSGNLDWAFLNNVPQDQGLHYAPTIPGLLFAKFQMMFAVITPLLLTGAIAERMKFSSFIIFIVSWSILIYYPLVHWIWGGGWLGKLGVVDFAGGIVIHTSAGMGALAAALVLGRRLNYGPSIMVPHSIPIAVLGSSLLWLGWFGFNAGSAYSAGALSGITIINTQVASAVAALIWVGLSWMRTGKPSVIAAINGAIAGLAGITPASGFVSVEHAFVIGMAVGIVSYLGVIFFKEKLRIDDALDVSSVHGVAGIIGAISIGFFASTIINTQVASAVAALIWVGLSWMRTGKPSVIAAINGAIAGLAGITPASGFVSVEHAFVIGMAVGIVSYLGVIFFKEKLRIDDALDVSSVHGVAGIIGAISIGFFASTVINPAGVNGLLFGHPQQLAIQAAGVAIAGIMGFGGTWTILKVIKALVGIRVSPKVEEAGLDIEEHAERAYSDEDEFGRM